MTPREIELVRGSFEKILPNVDRLADSFYVRLFEVTPEIRPMFSGDLEEQKQKFAAMLVSSINNLHQLYMVMPQIREMGRRHADYGVLTEHYALVGGALLWALQQNLGQDFTPEMRSAWTEAYTTLAGAMNGAS